MTSSTFGTFFQTLDQQAWEEEFEEEPPPEEAFSPPPVQRGYPDPETPGAQTPQPRAPPNTEGVTPEKGSPPQAQTPQARSPKKAQAQQAPVANDFEEDANWRSGPPLRYTPRTIEALKRTGIEWAETQPREYKTFAVHGGGDLPEMQKMRYQHFEVRRGEKIELVRRERQRIIDHDRVHGKSPADPQAARNLQAIESLLDDELRRLEKNLRSQVRVHSAVEQSNTSQLMREDKLAKKLDYRKERIGVVARQVSKKGENMRTIMEAKELHSRELQDVLEATQAAKQAEFLAEQLEEEVRLEEHRKQKDISGAEKSERWRAKCNLIRRRKEEVDLTHEIWGQGVEAKAEQKHEQIEAKKEAALRAHKISHAEMNLRMVDARGATERLKRLDRNRRDALSEAMLQAQERVRAFQAVRQQVIDQRKKRIVGQSLLKSKPQDIQYNTPGPGHYGESTHISCLNELPVPKISSVKPKLMVPGSTDHMMKLAKENPPPGTYVPTVLPKGQHLDLGAGVDGSSVRIVAPGEKEKNFVDLAVHEKRDVPAPGMYKLPSTIALKSGPRMKQKVVDKEFDFPSYIPRPPDHPGPTEYAVDPWLKDERLKRGGASMPALRSALNMA